MSEDRVLPKDAESDYSLPGRAEESNFACQPVTSHTDTANPKSRGLAIGIAVFAIISAGFYSYYFLNQGEIDAHLVQSAMRTNPEQMMADRYNVGEYGSDHAHAAILVVVDGEQLNFGLPQFQLASGYIHFEDHNPYQIHRHATGVPLEMLFASIGLGMTQECIVVDNGFSGNADRFCAGEAGRVLVYLNGEPFPADISRYVIQHGDRILITLDAVSASNHQRYLDSFEIFDVPRKPLVIPDGDILV